VEHIGQGSSRNGELRGIHGWAEEGRAEHAARVTGAGSQNLAPRGQLA
jgi:hypothetical protein